MDAKFDDTLRAKEGIEVQCMVVNHQGTSHQAWYITGSLPIDQVPWVKDRKNKPTGKRLSDKCVQKE